MNGSGNPGKTGSYAMLRLKNLLRQQKCSNRGIPGVSRRPRASFTATELAIDLEDGGKHSPGESDPALWLLLPTASIAEPEERPWRTASPASEVEVQAELDNAVRK
jgi:hypothetical protein